MRSPGGKQLIEPSRYCRARRILVLMFGSACALLADPSQSSAQGVQAAGSPDTTFATKSCLDKLPPNVMTRVLVYASADTEGIVGSQAISAADDFTAAVAERMRVMLGAVPDSIPRAEPKLTWRLVGNPLIVTVRRDGTLTARPKRDKQDAAALMAKAVDSLRSTRDAFFAWPEQYPADSIVFNIGFHWASVLANGNAKPVSIRAGMPVFSMKEPLETSVRKISDTPPPYPAGALLTGWEGTVTLQFVVDSMGRAEPATIKRTSPSTGNQHFADEFFDEAKSAVLGSKFAPARFGDCPVPQLVTEPFKFSIEQSSPRGCDNVTMACRPLP